jgi:hypothetical protein
MDDATTSVIEIAPATPASIRTKPRYVRLNGVDFRPRGPVQFELTNIHARPINLGDPGPTNHPTNSTITQHSWAGGGQIQYANPNADMERFDWATVMTEYPHYLTLAPQTLTYHPQDSLFSMCLGDFPFGDSATMWFQSANDLYHYDASTDTLVAGPTLSVTAVGAGTVYRVQAGTQQDQVKLFIPGGSTGYDIFDGTNVTHKSGISVVDFAVWDDKLFALDVLGRVLWATDPMSDTIEPTVGATWTVVAQLADGSDPRHLVNYVNKSNEDTLYVITNNNVWGLDFANTRLVKSYFSWPRHPTQGWGAEHWRGELWVSVGMGAHRYDLSQVIPSGIDRDMGPPKDYRGYVSDIVGSYNDLFMYIRGTGVAATAPPPAITETLDVGFDPFQAGQPTPGAGMTNNLVVSWNGEGFHYRWAGQGVNPGNLFVSQADGRYTLWWANNGELLCQRLPFDYFNPLDPVSPNFTHEPVGYLETPWFDWGWTDQVKLLKRIELGVRRATPTERIDVFYKIDGDTNPWVPLLDADVPEEKQITHPGRFVFSLGRDLAHPMMGATLTEPCYLGLPHSHFKLRFELRRDPADATKRPVLDWWSAVGRKILNPIRTWRFNIDLTTQQMGNYPGGAAAYLQQLAAEPEAIQFDLGDESYMVELVALAGPRDLTTQEKASFLTVHLIEANDLPASTPETMIVAP